MPALPLPSSGQASGVPIAPHANAAGAFCALASLAASAFPQWKRQKSDNVAVKNFASISP